MAKKQNELSELETSFKPSSINKKPLCSNCHTSGHNKTMCKFAPCVSASICKDIKRHPDEDKYHKTVVSDLKAAKNKLKKIENDIVSKKESFASSLDTYAGKVQADLINSNKSKYLRETISGANVPNWLVVNTNIRKLERICNSKIPPKSEMQKLLNEYDEKFDVLTRKSAMSDSVTVNPVRRLWVQKGIRFPGKGVLPNSRRESASTTTANLPLWDEPTSLEEENHHLQVGLKESMKTCHSADDGLSLLLDAARFVSDVGTDDSDDSDTFTIGNLRSLPCCVQI